jgi:hypothetical protein
MIYKLQAITVFAYSSHAAKDIAAICQDLMRVSLWMGFAAWGVGGVQVEVGGAHTVVDKRRLARRMIAQEEHHRAGRDVLRLGKGAKHPLVDWQESWPVMREAESPCERRWWALKPGMEKVVLGRGRAKISLVELAGFPLEILHHGGVALRPGWRRNPSFAHFLQVLIKKSIFGLILIETGCALWFPFLLVVSNFLRKHRDTMTQLHKNLLNVSFLLDMHTHTGAHTCTPTLATMHWKTDSSRLKKVT